MATKSMKDATAANASIFNQIAQGQSAADVKDVQNVKGVKRAKYANEERLNLKIPTYIKEYLQAAAYEASNAKHTVSITEYICDLVTADMEKHKGK